MKFRFVPVACSVRSRRVDLAKKTSQGQIPNNPSQTELEGLHPLICTRTDPGGPSAHAQAGVKSPSKKRQTRKKKRSIPGLSWLEESLPSGNGNASKGTFWGSAVAPATANSECRSVPPACLAHTTSLARDAWNRPKTHMA